MVDNSMTTYKKFTHCGDDYYVGISTPITPNCEECGEKIDEEPVVEVYDENILHDSKPVETFETVEDWKQDAFEDRL